MLSTAKMNDCKRRLDEVFGSYDQFAEFITKPGVKNSAIYGVVDSPMSPSVEEPFSQYNSEYEDWSAPSTSASEQLPTEEVLQSMQCLVSQKLSDLDCSSDYPCPVIKEKEVSKKEQTEGQETTTECGHSPDSGFTESSSNYDQPAQSNEQLQWPTLEVEQILEHVGHVSPLLSPLPATSYTMDEPMDEEDSPPPPPTKKESPRKGTKVTLDLTTLSQESRQKLLLRWKKPPKEEVKADIPPAQEPKKPVETVKKANPFEDSMPTKKAFIKVPTQGKLVEYFQSKAREVKHCGDGETEKVKKVLHYMESVVFFIMAASYQPKEDYTLTSDTVTFLKSTTSMFTSAKIEKESPLFARFKSRVRTLGLMVQACLAFHLYNARCEQAMKNQQILEKEFSQQRQQNTKSSAVNSVANSTNNSTPSPASSTHSSNIIANGNSSKDTVSIPANVYAVQSQQTRIMSHLIWGHKLWKDAFTNISPTNKEFVNRLNSLCGELKLYSELKDIAEFLLTAVSWMKAEYGLETNG